MARSKMNIVTDVVDATKQASMGFSFDMSPSALILVAQFDKLGLDIRSFKEPLHRSIKYMGKSFQQNFDQGGRPYKWDALKDSTIERKAAAGYSQPEAPLIRTGKLRKVVGQQNIWTINGIEGYAAITSLREADYGIYHQRGVQGPKVGVLTRSEGLGGPTTRLLGSRRGYANTRAVFSGTPIREFLVFQNQDEQIIEEIFIEWFAERAAANGFSKTAGGAAVAAATRPTSVKSFAAIKDLFGPADNVVTATEDF